MTPGLWIFVVTVAVNAVVLLIDDVLIRSNLRSITAWVHLYPLLGVPLVAWQLLGALGLAMHLYRFGTMRPAP